MQDSYEFDQFEKPMDDPPSSRNNKQPSKHPSQKLLAHFEEGEVQYLEDNSPYIVDPQFSFKTDPFYKVNWKLVQSTNIPQLKLGTGQEELAKHIPNIAYCNLKDEEHIVWISKEGREAMRAMQMGMQYMLFVQQKIADKANLIHSYLDAQQQQYKKLEDFHMQQRMKMARYKKMKQKLVEQSVHFELMLNRMNTDILKERLSMVKEKDEILADEESVFNKILKEKGILSNKTMQQPSAKESQTQLPQMNMMSDIMNSLKRIQEQIDDIKKQPPSQVIQTQIVQQQPIIQHQEFGTQNLQQQHYVRPVHKRQGTPVKDQNPLYQPINEQSDPKRQSQESDKKKQSIESKKDILEKGIVEAKSEKDVDEYKEDFESNGSDQFSRGSSLKDEDKNVVTIEDIDGSQKSNKASSRQRAKWEKPQTSNRSGQEIESIISKESSSQGSLESPKFNDDQFKSPGRRLVAGDLKKQQTPIKEEDAEESEVEEKIEEVKKEQILNETKNYEDESFVNEEYLKSSGLVVDSQSLKPKSDKNRSQEESPSKKFNNPIEAPPQQNDEAQSIPSEVNQEDDEDEYRDDDFEQESQKSGVHGTVSQSGLPPLASGKINKSQSLHVNIEEQFAQRKTNLLPQDFNLNIAESQLSIDFDLSTSQMDKQYPVKHGSKIENLMKKKMDELNESGDYMDSNDFQVSESGFSQSFRSKDAASVGVNSKGSRQPQQKKQFYFYEQQKFSSYNKNSTNNSVDGDDDF